MLGPTIPGKKVRLEPPQRDDLRLVNSWWADLKVVHYWPDQSVPSMEHTEESYDRAARDPATVLWCISLNGRVIGSTWIAAINFVNREAESGLLIGVTSAWGKGYAGEAVRLRTDYAFENLGLERLQSFTSSGNIGMHRALEKSGYRQIATKRRCLFRSGAWQDEFVFELLRIEWSAARNRSSVFR